MKKIKKPKKYRARVKVDMLEDKANLTIEGNFDDVVKCIALAVMNVSADAALSSIDIVNSINKHIAIMRFRRFLCE